MSAIAAGVGPRWTRDEAIERAMKGEPPWTQPPWNNEPKGAT